MRIFYTKSSVNPDGTRNERVTAIRCGEAVTPEVTRENLSETHDLVYEYEENLFEQIDLEAVFEAFQGENLSPPMELQLKDRNADHMSMSVGDIVELNTGELFAVAPVGFRPVNS